MRSFVWGGAICLVIRALRLLLRKLIGIHGNHELLVGRDDADGDLAARLGDDGLRSEDILVLLLVELNAHELQAFAGRLAAVPLILADTAREEEDVYTTHGGSVGADVFADAVVVHILRQCGPLVAIVASGLNLTHIGCCAGDAEEA